MKGMYQIYLPEVDEDTIFSPSLQKRNLYHTTEAENKIPHMIEESNLDAPFLKTRAWFNSLNAASLPGRYIMCIP